MKITVTKVIRELEKKHGWYYIDEIKALLIKDVLTIVNDELKMLKQCTNSDHTKKFL